MPPPWSACNLMVLCPFSVPFSSPIQFHPNVAPRRGVIIRKAPSTSASILGFHAQGWKFGLKMLDVSKLRCIIIHIWACPYFWRDCFLRVECTCVDLCCQSMLRMITRGVALLIESLMSVFGVLKKTRTKFLYMSCLVTFDWIDILKALVDQCMSLGSLDFGPIVSLHSPCVQTVVLPEVLRMS